jgi:hypothetical protein
MTDAEIKAVFMECIEHHDSSPVWFARKVLMESAPVPLTPKQYNMIPELCAIKPSLYESIVRAIERAHGITA